MALPDADPHAVLCALQPVGAEYAVRGLAVALGCSQASADRVLASLAADGLVTVDYFKTVPLVAILTEAGAARIETHE